MALITIDAQQDTLDGMPFEIPGTSAILPKIRRLLDLFRLGSKAIVHIVRIYKKDGSNADICRRGIIEKGERLLLEGSSGCELAQDLFAETTPLDAGLLMSGGIQKISKSEVVIYKPRWGAFFKTPLEEHLSDLGVSTLIFTGCNFPNCPRTSIYEASERDFRIVMVSDAVSGVYEKGLGEMRGIGVEVVETDLLVANLKREWGFS
ncbi:MAG: cysteine hydrolase [Nitrospinota bacterium]|nr:cysteine hydrolase [Nitrospinota bacterium]